MPEKVGPKNNEWGLHKKGHFETQGDREKISKDGNRNQKHVAGNQNQGLTATINS